MTEQKTLNTKFKRIKDSRESKTKARKTKKSLKFQKLKKTKGSKSIETQKTKRTMRVVIERLNITKIPSRFKDSKSIQKLKDSANLKDENV